MQLPAYRWRCMNIYMSIFRSEYICYCRLYVSFLSRRSKVTSSERGSFLFLRTAIFPCNSSPINEKETENYKAKATFSERKTSKFLSSSVFPNGGRAGNKLFLRFHGKTELK